MKTEQHFTNLRKEVDKIYSVAQEARSKGYDPTDEVEIPLAMSMAEKAVFLISVIYPQIAGCGVDKRILELEKEYGKLDTTVSFKIAEEVANQKFCKFESLLEAIDAGIRIGFAYQTTAVVASPLEGYTGLKIRKTRDGKEYFEASFSGPIRSAGTTASCVCLMLIDYLRELFGFAKYDPTEDEIKRTWTELEFFHDRITNLQYMPLEEEALFLARNLPIQIAGDPSEKLEVPNYKNLDRVDTNFLRSGFCLILAEGLAQKGPKAFRLYKKVQENGIKATGFNFIQEYIGLHEKLTSGSEKKEKDSVPTYIKDLVAGRPIFGHPSRSGSFRFRYGRGRTSGFSAASLHPATMAITDGFIAIGTQLKIEKPTKGCVVTSCDKIEGPIIKLKNGSVRKMSSREEAKKIYDDVEEIIYIGDILFPFSDVLNRNADLLVPGYVEEWWYLELKEKSKDFEKDFDYYNVSLEDALKLSRQFKIPLHPKHIFYWPEISKEEFLNLLEWLKFSKLDEKIILPFTKQDQEEFALGKRALELLGVPHEVIIENIVISKENSKTLMVNLGFDLDIFEEKNLFVDLLDVSKFKFKKFENCLDLVNSVSKFEIKNKSGEFIGSRMGRPEKAKVRKLTGSPNVLFPVGREGGRLRSVQAACEVGFVKGQFPINYCEFCQKNSIFRICESCGKRTKEKYYFYDLKETSFEKKLKISSVEGKSSMFQKAEIGFYLEKAREKVGLINQEMPLLIKGVRGMSSDSKIPENLVKGILRAKYGLQVNKDGTIRMDATELPLTSFKPKEIRTSVEKLKELGYDKDIEGKDLENSEQILELMPHDVLIPSSNENPEEKGEDVFLKICNFIDELLKKLYGLEPFYNVKSKEDLVGKLGVFMAPHNCAGVVCRFIGFSNTLGLMASPYMHAAVRRDCFHKDTYVPIKEKGKWNIIKIGDLVNRMNPNKVVDGWGTKEKRVKDFSAVGILKEVGEVNVKNFSKHIKNNVYEIKTSLGKKIKITENHKFLVDENFTEAKNLNIGDKIPLPYKINIFSEDKKEINLLESLKTEKIMVRQINEIIFELKEIDLEKILKNLKITKKQFSNYKRRDSYPAKFVLSLNKKTQNKIYDVGKIAIKRDNVKVPIIIKLEKSLLEAIGLYIAEGYSRSITSKKGLNQVYISSSDEKIRDFIKKTIKNSFGLVPSENKQDRVTFSSKILYSFFIKILGCGSIAKEKRIPSIFLDLPLKRLAGVLRGYFEGDGSVSKGDIRVSCDSVSEGLLYDLEFCLARFGIFAKRYEYEKEPGPKIREFYLKKKRRVPKFKITKLTVGSDFLKNFFEIGFLSDRKKKILNLHKTRKFKGMRIEKDNFFVYDPIISIKELGKEESYSLNVKSKNHLVLANSIISKNCDGDEAAIMLLGDVLLNFSRKFLPSHRGGTQDAPLVLNAKIDAGEVDDQILDFEAVNEYPLELYNLAEQKKHSSEVKVYCVRDILKQGKDPFTGLGFTHNTADFNEGVHCSSYKTLGLMQEKVEHQMALVEKLRAVDTSDTARLIIERHFMRDMRGNLRSFSTQTFRCVGCNEIVRRPPLSGVCLNCGGKLIFTINEGGIRKYLEPALGLAKRYDLSIYLKQNLDLVKSYIDSVFGREKEKQEKLESWF